MTRILVAIANHGTGNRQYLDELIKTYRSMPYDIKIVVLSNIEKDLGPDIEVRVGVPTSNPWSLPFAHRPLFREQKDNFDYFIYSEDDTLVTQEGIDAFIQSVDILEPDEIAGYIRTELGPQDKLRYCSVHSHIRWIADSICERGGKLWAQLSNEHSAFYMVTRAQLLQAIRSGGFPDEPHETRYDMLCAAATDIYISCGFTRLVCIDGLDKFTLRHLPNKYIGQLGISEESLKLQLDSLRKIYHEKLPNKELYNVESSLPRYVASKNLYEVSDETLNDLMDQNWQKILFWGIGDGTLEKSVTSAGSSIHAVLYSHVFHDVCQSVDINVIDDPGAPTLKQAFDSVISIDNIHLFENPDSCIDQLKSYISNGGQLILRVPNLRRLNLLKLRLRHPLRYFRWNRATTGVHVLTARSLRRKLKASGFSEVAVKPVISEKWAGANKTSLGLLEHLFATSYYAVAK